MTCRSTIRIIAITCLVLTQPAPAQVSYSAAALTGQAAPGGGGAIYATLRAPLLNNAGQIAFRAELAGGGRSFDWGIFAGFPEAMNLLARSSEPAPGAPLDFSYGSGVQDPYALAPYGAVLYWATLKHSQMSSEGWGLWAASGRESQYVVGRTIIPPGMDDYIENLRGATMNGSGTVALTATLNGPNVGSNYMGIWAGPVGNLQPVARMGQQAPGCPPGVNYYHYHMDIAFSSPALSSDGQIAFSGYTAPPDAGGFGIPAAWAGQPGALHLLAREGDPAPGFPAGATFAGIGMPAMAPSGRMALDAYLDSGERAIYSGTTDDFQLAVRSGDPAPGTADAKFAFLQPPLVNSSGRLAFMASATVAGGGTSTELRGIWAGTRDALELITLFGGRAPGAQPDTTFWSLEAPLINDLGQVALGAFLSDLNSGGQHAASLYVFDPAAGMQLIVREDQQIDIGSGQWRTIRDLDTHSVAFNNCNQLAFLATFDDGSSAVLIATVPEPTPSLLLALLVPCLLASRFHGAAGTGHPATPVMPRPSLSIIHWRQ